MKKIRLFFLTFILSSCAFSADYDVIVDPNFSPYMGGQDLISGFKILMVTEDALIPPTDPPREGWAPALGRLGELVLFWNPLGQIATVTQHEVFGHGYRIRDLSSSHAKVDGYKIGLPFPYSISQVGGATQFSISPKLTVAEINSINLAGIEAQDILARQLKMKWIADRHIDGRTSELYFMSQQALFLYAVASHDSELDIEGFKGDDDPFDGDDIKSYIFWLNQMYPEDKLTSGKLRSKAGLNFIDAYTYYATYAWWYYVMCGKPAEAPMIHLWGGVDYMPNYKLSLAPYGLENYVENFFAKDKQPYYFYVKWGDRGGNHYWGLGFEGTELFSWKRGTLGLKADFWRQPDFLQPTRVFDVLEDKQTAAVPQLKDMRYGGSGSLISKLYLGGEKIPFYLYLEAGYKSKGYLPGYSLTKGFVGRAGLSGKF